MLSLKRDVARGGACRAVPAAVCADRDPGGVNEMRIAVVTLPFVERPL